MNFCVYYPRILLLITIFLFNTIAQADHYPYLRDDASHTAAAPMNVHGYPRVILTETKNLYGNAESFTKYHIIGAQGAMINKVAEIQSLNNNVMYFWHVSPRASQAFLLNYCEIGAGMAFESSGPTTQGGPPSRGCSVFAGHWLYKAGIKLTQAINTTAKTLKVANTSSFKVGQYVVIYNAPAGSFNGAEHAKITAINASTKTLTLASRGFKSTPRSHAVGAIVAQHVQGQGLHPENWSYNMSTQSPKDANGKTAGRAFVDWFKANIGKDKKGNPVNVRVDGIQFDADFYFELASKKADANNDLVVDNGMSPAGVNWWGLGLESFYQQMRTKFPSKIIIAGNRNVRGFASLNGTQMEGFPAKNRDSSQPVFDDLNSQFSRYSFHLHNNKAGPLHTHNLNKTPTKAYPENAQPKPTSNSTFRLGLGLTLLDDGYYGHENSSYHPDPWYDEYAVNVTPNSSNYGRAIASDPNNESAIRANMGWLGNPLGERYRLYDHGVFNASQSLLANGHFDSTISGWIGKTVNLSRDTAIKQDGSASLKVSKMTSYKLGTEGARVAGPTASIVQGNQYTLVFSARASSIREFTASVGPNSNRFIVGPNWRRFVLTFKAKRSRQEIVAFGVGRENTQMWIDSVQVFKGNANVFRRNFQNGTVVVNATPSQKTVALGETFLRIKGAQDVINNGTSVSSVTIKPWDAAILVRPDGAGADTGAPPPSGGVNPCGKPNFNLNTETSVVIWKVCDGSGQWHVRAMAGNSGGSVNYTGSIDSSSGNFTNVNAYDLESHDSLQVSSNQPKINLNIRMWDGFVDGVSFKLPVNATVCFNLTPGNKILAGKNRALLTDLKCVK